jgi:hypothetical protein
MNGQQRTGIERGVADRAGHHDHGVACCASRTKPWISSFATVCGTPEYVKVWLIGPIRFSSMIGFALCGRRPRFRRGA